MMRWELNKLFQVKNYKQELDRLLELNEWNSDQPSLDIERRSPGTFGSWVIQAVEKGAEVHSSAAFIPPGC